jgi:transglutaminase-like putative cysteine protease
MKSERMQSILEAAVWALAAAAAAPRSAAATIAAALAVASPFAAPWLRTFRLRAQTVLRGGMLAVVAAGFATWLDPSPAARELWYAVLFACAAAIAWIPRHAHRPGPTRATLMLAAAAFVVASVPPAGTLCVPAIALAIPVALRALVGAEIHRPPARAWLPAAGGATAAALFLYLMHPLPFRLGQHLRPTPSSPVPTAGDVRDNPATLWVGLADAGISADDPRVIGNAKIPHRLPSGLYLRGAVYEFFQDGRWTEPTRVEPVPAGDSGGSRLADPLAAPTQTIEGSLRWFEGVRQIFLPGHPTFASIAPLVRRGEDGAVLLAEERKSTTRYRFAADWVDAADPRLDAVESSLVRPHLHAVPAELAARLRPFAEAAAGDARSPAERARRLCAAIRSSFTYTTEDPDPHAPPDRVLERRSGYCAQLASLCALALRTLGVPARLATGFRTAEYDAEDGTYIIRRAHAHAWTEVWLPSYGWVAFDPSPPAAAPLSSVDAPTPPATAPESADAARGRAGPTAPGGAPAASWTPPDWLAWSTLAILLAAAGVGLLLRGRSIPASLLPALVRPQRRKSATWAHRFLRALARIGVHARSGETLLQAAMRVPGERRRWAVEFVRLYYPARFGGAPWDGHRELRAREILNALS